MSQNKRFFLLFLAKIFICSIFHAFSISGWRHNVNGLMTNKSSERLSFYFGWNKHDAKKGVWKLFQENWKRGKVEWMMPTLLRKNPNSMWPSHWHLWIVKKTWGILIVVQIEHIGFIRPNGLKFRCICSTVELNPESTGHDSTFRNKVNNILARTGGTLRNPPWKQVLCFDSIFWSSEKKRQRDSCQLYSADQVKSLADWEFVAVQWDSFMRRGEKWFYTPPPNPLLFVKFRSGKYVLTAQKIAASAHMICQLYRKGKTCL